MEINNVNIIHEEMRIEKSFRRIDDDIPYRKKKNCLKDICFDIYLKTFLIINHYSSQAKIDIIRQYLGHFPLIVHVS